MKLSASVQRMLDALAFANVGENLTLRQKSAALGNVPAAVSAAQTPPPATTAERTQLALYLGSELPADVMDYVVRTCVRLHYGLTVLTMQTQRDAERILAFHKDVIGDAGLTPRIVPLTGESSRGLIQALRRRPEIAFLVCNESGYLSRSLMNGTQNGLPVPVVLVSRNGQAAAPVIESGATRAIR